MSSIQRAVELERRPSEEPASSLPDPRTPTTDPCSKWLFSRRVDLSVFLGSALVSLVALWVGAQTGVLYDDTPDWAWVPAVLLIDVAHVYATGFRVYLDSEELKRKPWLYALVPLIGYALGVALYSEGELVFWRALAYLAVFHFIRQQYGWVALYRARAGERDRLSKWIDTIAVYAATIYPLIYWHAHLPRQFWWFLAKDFTSLPVVIADVAEPLYWAALAAYAINAIYRWRARGLLNPGKDIVVATTALCWYVGIVAFNSDYAFTVTNVIIHGVPYLALIYWYGRARLERAGGRGPFRLFARGPVLFLLILWALAYAEEMFWDRTVWHERGYMFGDGWAIASLKMIIVPLLALPQITHYVLDGFIWRRKNNPDFKLVR
ncbi:MAG TPA: hypothetical protein VF131_08050 [Blastocatellia bacterium]|nr:hypothetical protein [Blastocatellia bacterium]